MKVYWAARNSGQRLSAPGGGDGAGGLEPSATAASSSAASAMAVSQAAAADSASNSWIHSSVPGDDRGPRVRFVGTMGRVACPGSELRYILYPPSYRRRRGDNT